MSPKGFVSNVNGTRQVFGFDAPFADANNIYTGPSHLESTKVITADGKAVPVLSNLGGMSSSSNLSGVTSQSRKVSPPINTPLHLGH